MSRHRLQLHPVNQLAKIDAVGDITEWSMNGNDPYFLLKGHPRKLPAGIYELTIDFPQGWDHLIEPTIYFDRGHGYNAADRIPIFFQALPEGQGTVGRAYFRLKSSARGLRLDPSSNAGSLFIGAVFLKRVPKLLWRASAFIAHHRKRIQNFSDLKCSLGKAINVFKRGGFAELNRSFKEVADRESSGSFYELPFDDFRDRCQSEAVKIRLKKHWTSDNFKPKDSALTILVPVYRVKAKWLEELLSSLASQTCTAFNLVLVFDGPQPELVKLAISFKGQIKGLELIELRERGGVSNACNAGIKASRTDYIVVVDHDDLLPDYFVEFFHRTIGEVPDSNIIYFDEALIDEEATREISMASRGAFDIRHYLSHPYIVHPIFFSKRILERTGGFNPSIAISQDVDLFLRCVDLAETVTHVPIVGYFWRIHEKSLGHAEMGQVAENTKSAINNFIRSHFGWPNFEVKDGPTFNTYEVSPPLPQNARVAIIIPTKDGYDLLRRCLNSIFDRKDANLTPSDIFVVDHQSEDEETLALLISEEAESRIKIISFKGPWNFSAINNAAVREIERLGDYTHYCFMNNDIVLQTKDWLDRLISRFSYHEVGIVGARLLYPDGRIQHGGVVVGLCGVAEHAFKFSCSRLEADQQFPGYLGSLTATRDYGAVTAALMLIPSSLFFALRGFDETLAVGFNDTDLCLRAGERGYKSCYVGSVTALHLESASRGAVPHNEDAEIFCRRHRTIIQNGDPHYGRYMNWTSPTVGFTFSYPKPFQFRITKMAPK